MTTMSSGHSSIAFTEIAWLLEEVRTDAEMSAAWGMCCEEGSDSKEGMEAVDDVDKLRGVMDSKEDGFDDYDERNGVANTSSFDLESYNRLSEDGTNPHHFSTRILDSRLSESIDEILMGFDEAGFDAEGIAIITLSPPLSSKCSFLCVPSTVPIHNPVIQTVRFVNVAFVFSLIDKLHIHTRTSPNKAKLERKN